MIELDESESITKQKLKEFIEYNKIDLNAIKDRLVLISFRSDISWNISFDILPLR